MAFYSCVDLNVGGGGGSAPSAPTTPPPSATKPPTAAPTTAPTTAPTAAPTTKPPAAGGGSAWAAGVAYKAGDEVTFEGKTYKCRQAHSSIRSWEPSVFTLALWLPL